MRTGQARKRDANEPAIVKGLQQHGVLVWPVSGKGVPDLLCYFRGQWSVLEVKMPKGALTDAQCDTRMIAPFPVVETLEQALAVLRCR